MTYKAQTFIDSNLKEIKDGHSETFESDYHIQNGNEIKFKGIFGSFIVISVTMDLQNKIIFLLVSPKIKP